MQLKPALWWSKKMRHIHKQIKPNIFVTVREIKCNVMGKNSANDVKN